MPLLLSNPGLIAFDLDGTLAESKRPVTPLMGELMGKLLEKIPVAVMSGGAFPQFEKQFLPALPANARLDRLYIFPTSAAQCWTLQDGEWQPEYENELTDTQKKLVLQALNESLTETGLIEMPPQVWGERIEDRGTQISFSPLGQQAPVDAKKAWNAEFDSTRMQLRTMLEEKLPAFSVATGGLTTIDITQKGINKAYGVRELERISGVAIADMLYVGDALEPGGNDSVVIETGIKTHSVKDPKETAALIEQVLIG